MKYPKYLPSYWFSKIFSLLLVLGAIAAAVFAYYSFTGANFLQANALNYDQMQIEQKVLREELAGPAEDFELSIDELDQYKMAPSLVDTKVVRKDIDLNLNVNSLAASTGSAELGSDSLSFPYTKNFLVSAYYSPLPCQNRYSTGSYEGDLRLNGNGVAGASGQSVYPGMIAAPKNYPFGTKLNIAGMGTGTVWDRGGAIVAGGVGGYDRLDVWTGYGDEGLTRALNFGKRVVSVTVYGVDSSIPDNMYLNGYSESEKNSGCDEEKKTVDHSVPAPVEDSRSEEEVKMQEQSMLELMQQTGMNEDLGIGDSGPDVTELQEELVSFNFLKSEPTGYFDEITEHAVFKFQQAHGIVASKSDFGAGHFGPKTRGQMANLLVSRKSLVAEVPRSTASQHVAAAVIAPASGKIEKELDFGVRDPEVRKVQAFLRDKGFFKYPYDTDFFGPATFDAVLAYQLDRGIIASTSDVGAGRVGPGTRSRINSELSVLP